MSCAKNSNSFGWYNVECFMPCVKNSNCFGWYNVYYTLDNARFGYVSC